MDRVPSLTEGGAEPLRKEITMTQDSDHRDTDAGTVAGTVPVADTVPGAGADTDTVAGRYSIP